MSNLIVNALSEDTFSAPGNRNANYIVVSVTDSNGVPVTGLGIPNFKVDPVIEASVGPFGERVNINLVNPARLPGFYIVYVAPIQTQTSAPPWKPGVYIFAVSVTNGVNQGQTLCSVMMD